MPQHMLQYIQEVMIMKKEVVEIRQSNEICRREWIISGLGHNLVMCVLAKYQEQGIKLEDMAKPCYVRIPVAKLLSGQKWTSGGNQYQAIKRMVKTALFNAVIFDRKKTVEGFSIFYGKVRIDKETNEIICSLNPEMYKFWFELTGNYARLELDKVLALPLNTTAHLLYQCLISYKWKKQCEVDYEEFKLELGCEKMENRDFARRILAKYQKDFTERNILHWEYELVRGRYNKIVALRLWFPASAEEANTINVEAKPVEETAQTDKKRTYTKQKEEMEVILAECSPMVQEALEEWIKYKREKNQPFTPTMARQLLKKYPTMTDEELCKAIRDAIRHGWNDIYDNRDWHATASTSTGQTQEKKPWWEGYNWRWVAERYPQEIERATVLSVTGKWKGALTRLQQYFMTTDPDDSEEQENIIVRFRDECQIYEEEYNENQQELF